MLFRGVKNVYISNFEQPLLVNYNEFSYEIWVTNRQFSALSNAANRTSLSIIVSEILTII